MGHSKYKQHILRAVRIYNNKDCEDDNMLSVVNSASIFGIDAYRISVEVSLRKGLRKIILVGLPDTAVRESKQRVISAILNSGYNMPRALITVSLAPAEIKKQGSAFDLPIAIAILSSKGNFAAQRIEEYIIVGELSLNSQIKPIRGILSIASGIKKMGYKKIILPLQNAKEASYVKDIEIYPAKSLLQVINHFSGGEQIVPYPPSNFKDVNGDNTELDFSEVKGQQFAKRALEIAAAGGHNVLLVGPPGSGKTMLAQRLPTILPDMRREEALETTKIHSVAGLLDNQKGLITKRPFRAPHHTVSYAGLAGGGTIPRPGEISLAHNGVLFLDELLEFQRNVLEILRQPLEDGFIRISRASASITYPARFMLVAATNPCPCGFYLDPIRVCKCSTAEIKRYFSRISGPLLDRIDINIFLQALQPEELLNKHPNSELSSLIKTRVEEARLIQAERFNKSSTFFNAHMRQCEIDKYCSLSPDCQKLMNYSMKKLGFTARAFTRILKVARTISDLQKKDYIQESDLAEAIQYHTFDKLIKI